MASGRMNTVVRRLRQTALFDAGLDDGDLLERYLSCRDETAFAALVRRHGPMVLGVCRRILGNIHDADDAFQATFLILVRKAPSIFPRGQVGPWLYGVAYRTSLKAKAMSSRRRSKQQVLQDVPGPQPPAHDEWLELLDREVNRLPDKYRLPIVLCDLEGKTRKQAARQLGWPEGTVATRLQHGRALVQKRLARHGLPLSAGAITLVWVEAISAASVPARLLASTVQTASVFSAGTVAGSIPLKVTALAQGVLHAMVLSKVKNVSAILMMLGVLGLGLGGLNSVSRTAAAAQPPTDETQPTRSTSPPETKNAVDQTSAVTFLDSGTVEHGGGRLPTGPAPVQALVSFDKGKVVVRTNQFYYEPRTVHTGNQAVTRYELRHLLRSDRYERDQVEVYDTRSRKLDNKDMPKWLKVEIPALVLVGSRELDPLHLRLIKDGTLVFVLPTSVAAPATVVGTPPPASPVGVPTVVPPGNVFGPTPLAVPQYSAPNDQAPPQAPRTQPVPVERPAALSGDRPIFYAGRNVQIPVNVNDARLKELRELMLYVSSDLGKTWQHDCTIAPTQSAFTFTATADGAYWFRVVAVHRSGKREPDSISSGPPDMKIVIDTKNPPPAYPPLAVPQTPPITESRNEAAEREMAIAEFYLKAGHRMSAAFYYELVQKHHPDTSHAKKAMQFLQELRAGQLPPPHSPKTAARVGQIHIVGNKRVPDVVIREALELYPGQFLDYKQVIAAEERLRGLKDLVYVSPIVNIRPVVSVIESAGDSQYKDILVTVNESLRLDVLAEFEKLNGAWTVIKAASDGKAIPNMVELELTFQGDRVTSKNGKNSTGGRSSITLDLTTKPKGFRLTPIDGPAGADSWSGTYEIAGDTLKLSMRTMTASPGAGTMSGLIVLTLKRKVGEPIADTTDRHRMILDSVSKGMKIAAEAFEIQTDGRVRLTDAEITYRPSGQPAHIVRGKRVVLTLDGPVRDFSDLNLRQILTIDADGASLTVSPK